MAQNKKMRQRKKRILVEVIGGIKIKILRKEKQREFGASV